MAIVAMVRCTMGAAARESNAVTATVKEAAQSKWYG